MVGTGNVVRGVNAVLVGDQSEIAHLYSIGKMGAASVRQTWLRNRVQAEGWLRGVGGIAYERDA